MCICMCVRMCRYGWEEIEGGGCVVWALEMMFRASGDLQWLREEAAPLIFSIARFFASRVTPCRPPSHNASLFCLNHVMGPDEAHAPVDNSAFVSGIAAWSLGECVSECVCE